MFLRRDATVSQQVNDYLSVAGILTISRITEHEIRRGLLFKNATAQLRRFGSVLQNQEILEFTETASSIASDLYVYLRRKGELIQDADLFIASIALANDCVLVTNNERHFKRIEPLEIENWTEALS